MTGIAWNAVVDNDGPGKVGFRLTVAQDAGPAIRAAELQRKLEADRLNKKAEIRPQAKLPMTVVMSIKQRHGIDALKIRPDQEKRFWQILQTEYPALLTTQKKVYRAPKREKIRFAPGTLSLAP
jgi:hypothetical protein